MSYDYVKAISTFPNNDVDPSLLKYQIDEDETVTTALNSISTDVSDCTMTFASEPSGAEKTAVDALIALHTTALIATWLMSNSCCAPQSLTTTQRDALMFPPDGAMLWNTTDGDLQVWNGSIWVGAGDVTTIVFGQTPYTVLDTDRTILCDCTGGAIQVDLIAAASAPNRMLSVKKIDSSENAVTIDANSTEEIDGELTEVLATQFASVSLETDASDWWII